jgi:hypothetical protein
MIQSPQLRFSAVLNTELVKQSLEIDFDYRLGNPEIAGDFFACSSGG